MNYTNPTTSTDAMALNMADITALTWPVEIEAADRSTEGASWADAMATIGTIDLTATEWAATIYGFRRD